MSRPPIIDAHVHVTPDGSWFGSAIDASEERLLREMDQARLDGALLIPVCGVADEAFVAQVCRRHPDRLAGLGMLELAGPLPLDKQVLRAHEELGLVGLKIHPRMQGLVPADPRLAPALDEAGRLGLPVMFCTNLGPGPAPLAELTPLHYDALAKRHSGTTFILAHAGVHRVLDAFWVAKSNPNVYLDISMVLAYLRGFSVCRDILLVAKRLDRKVLYGSDFPEHALDDYRDLALAGLQEVGGCDFAAVFGSNALKLMPGWRPGARDFECSATAPTPFTQKEGESCRRC
jgi:predicted TIM-barrel fold metal-dependent hydrolase